MLESFLVTFRESLEAALIVGIVLAFLRQNKKQNFYSVVLLSLAAATVTSLFFAYLFSLVEGGFSGRNEQIFEGVTMILATIFLSYMILWLYKEKNIGSILRQKLQNQRSNVYGLFFLVFFAVLREGVETVFFLNAVKFNSGHVAFGAGFFGIFAALFLGYLFFIIEIKIPVKRFFQVSSFFLVLFAAGLFAHGIHELEEAGFLPILVEHLYNINTVFDEKSTLGTFAKGVFGYNGNPSLSEVIGYAVYVISAFILFYRKPRHVLSSS
ncbi:FTR1 family protein [Candidatus Peregrinibacteria bacterium]|nr:FTR1 family protein [Candidatus Peregrinibacteria bacterium]